MGQDALPSIAANNPAFKNIAENNWSWQPEGLTFQRAVSAFENYGHYMEIGLVSERLIMNLKKENKFTQQYDPFSGRANRQS